MTNMISPPGKNGSPSIFRQQAIDALNTVEETQAELKAIKSYRWILLIICSLLLISILIWCFLGEIKLEAESSGLIFTREEMQKADEAIQLAINEKTEKRNELADLLAKKQTLFSKHYLTRVDLIQAKNEYREAERDLRETESNLTNIFYSEPIPPLTALTFIDHIQAKKISVGMPSRIFSLTHPNHKPIPAHVIAISSTAITKQLAHYYLPNESLIEKYFNQSVPFMIKIALDNNALMPGSFVTAKIIYLSCKPYQFLMKSVSCG